MRFPLLLPSFLCSFLHNSALGVTVLNTNDNGPGSLRWAIETANTSAAPASITFNIPGPGPHVIRPSTALPAVTNAVAIDGYTQPGARGNTLLQGNDAVILIEITTNLVLQAAAVEVLGLAIQGLRLNRDGVTIQGNFIGLDATGNNKMSGASGIYSNSTFGHQIGGVDPGDRNVISGNTTGIGGFGAPNPLAPSPPPTVIEGNYTGTDRSGATGQYWCWHCHS